MMTNFVPHSTSAVYRPSLTVVAAAVVVLSVLGAVPGGVVQVNLLVAAKQAGKVRALQQRIHDHYGLGPTEMAAAAAAKEGGDTLPPVSAPQQQRRQNGNVDLHTKRQLYSLIDINEVSKVDGVEQSFAVDFYLTNLYEEPDLVGLTVAEHGVALKEERSDNLLAGFGLISLEFTNKRELETLFEERLGWVGKPPILDQFGDSINVTNASSNWVELTGRYSGYFSAQLSLADFPFDTQYLEIGVEPLLYEIEQVEFVAFAPHQNYISRMTPLLEWTTKQMSKSVFEYRYDLFDQDFSRHTWRLDLDRIPDFYVNKIATGIILIVLMTHGLFIVEVTDTNRVVGAMASFFGIVSYLFVVSDSTPKVAYTTRMDSFVNLAFFNCFADWLVAIVVYKLQDSANLAKHAAVDVAVKEKEAAVKRSQLRRCSRGSSSPSLNMCDGEEVPLAKQRLPIGWWDFWEKKKRVIDLAVAIALTTQYIMGCIIIRYAPMSGIATIVLVMSLLVAFFFVLVVKLVVSYKRGLQKDQAAREEEEQEQEAGIFNATSNRSDTGETDTPFPGVAGGGGSAFTAFSVGTSNQEGSGSNDDTYDDDVCDSCVAQSMTPQRKKTPANTTNSNRSNDRQQRKMQQYYFHRDSGERRGKNSQQLGGNGGRANRCDPIAASSASPYGHLEGGGHRGLEDVGEIDVGPPPTTQEDPAGVLVHGEIGSQERRAAVTPTPTVRFSNGSRLSELRSRVDYQPREEGQATHFSDGSHPKQRVHQYTAATPQSTGVTLPPPTNLLGGSQVGRRTRNTNTSPTLTPYVGEEEEDNDDERIGDTTDRGGLRGGSVGRQVPNTHGVKQEGASGPNQHPHGSTKGLFTSTFAF